MKKIYCWIVAGIVAGFTSVAHAQYAATTTYTNENDRDYDRGMLYRAHELDFDLFGSAALGEETLENLSGSRLRHHILGGGGAGITAFFCRYVGVGGEFNADARASRFVDDASGNVYLRFPIHNTGLAPYAFGGGGYQFEEVRQAFGQGGAGLEFRFCRDVGVFVDGRWVFAERTEDYGLARVGVRLSF